MLLPGTFVAFLLILIIKLRRSFVICCIHCGAQVTGEVEVAVLGLYPFFSVFFSRFRVLVLNWENKFFQPSSIIERIATTLSSEYDDTRSSRLLILFCHSKFMQPYFLLLLLAATYEEEVRVEPKCNGCLPELSWAYVHINRDHNQ